MVHACAFAHTQIPEVPFDIKKHIVPNIGGRVQKSPSVRYDE
jgi:hypothetical protein